MNKPGAADKVAVPHAADGTIRLMTRYKGRTKADLIEHDFPHHVDIVVPQRGHGRLEANGSIIRWCFADETAGAFSAEFGGNLIRS